MAVRVPMVQSPLAMGLHQGQQGYGQQSQMMNPQMMMQFMPQMGGGGMGGGAGGGGMMSGMGSFFSNPYTWMAAGAAKDIHGVATGRYSVGDILTGRQLEKDLKPLGKAGKYAAAIANPVGFLLGKIF